MPDQGPVGRMMRRLRISLLHLAPITSDVAHNRKLVEVGVKAVAQQGADWAITPELCISGYLFMNQIGTDWILPQPDGWMQDFCHLVKEHRLTVFLSHPERDPNTDKLYNSVFVINPHGEIIGKHRKIKALGGAEAWSSPGREIDPVECDGVKVGILICADAYKNEVAQELKDKGAQVLVSPVSWGPGGCAPRGEWEQRTADTGLPIMVCNRSGVEEEELDYRTAESVVAQHGKRLLTAISDRSVVLSFDWDMDTMTLLSPDFQRAYL
jgi:N-carbamoylputrescine amidase